MKTEISEALVRESLQSDFVKRNSQNAQYSLRAFAQYLGIDQSYLIKMMQGKRKISGKMREKLAEKITIPQNVSINPKFNPITDVQFKMVAEWYCFAILELIKTKDFKADLQTVSERLGIHKEVARIAIDRLLTVGLISKKGRSGKFISTSNTWSQFNFTSLERQRLQIQFLEKAQRAVETVPIERRDNGSLTIAVRSKDLPEIKKQLTKIRQDFHAYLKDLSSTELDEVYQLSVAFFPLTTRNKNGDLK